MTFLVNYLNNLQSSSLNSTILIIKSSTVQLKNLQDNQGRNIINIYAKQLFI
jgi:hypothetical protein